MRPFCYRCRQMSTGLRLHAVLLVARLASGCRLPGSRGPGGQSLVDCRQLSQKGIAALEQGRRQEAETLLAEAVNACPRDPQARRYYAEALWQRGAKDDAVVHMEEAVKLAGQNAELLARMAEMYLETGEVQLAKQSVEQAIDVNPKLSLSWAVRGRVMRVQGRTRQALADYHRALGYAPDDRQVLLEVAELYRELNRPQLALATLHSLADTYPSGEEPQQVLHMTGLAYRALGRHEDAETSLAAAASRERRR